MFTKSGLRQLHQATHESLDILLRHVETIPEELLGRELAGFGFPTVRKQVVHILTVEEGWVHDLQYKDFPGWFEEDAPTLGELHEQKKRIFAATQAFLDSLNEEQLNTTLVERPDGWSGELRSPAFVLLHVVTHTFHHKGQVVAMLRVLGHPAPDTDMQRG